MAESSGSDNAIRFDASYIRTIPGLLKVGVVGFSLLGLISNAVIRLYEFGGWYYFHATTCLIVSLILLLLYLVRVPWAVTIIAWYLSELIYCAIFCIFFAIGSIGTLISFATFSGYIVARIFTALFGVGATCCLGYDAFLKFTAHQAGESGPGSVRQTVTATGQV